eukprot:3863218-Rhodomonas_salina.1
MRPGHGKPESGGLSGCWPRAVRLVEAVGPGEQRRGCARHPHAPATRNVHAESKCKQPHHDAWYKLSGKGGRFKLYLPASRASEQAAVDSGGPAAGRPDGRLPGLMLASLAAELSLSVHERAP